MKFSIIIPTLNEEENIQRLLIHLQKHANSNLREIIVVDGGSSDETCTIAKDLNVKILQSPKKGRATQMNLGATHASGDVLYFVHADTLPPESYMKDLEIALVEKYPIGCFRFRFNSNKKILRFNSYMTRFDRIWVRGGDQSLFITRTLFDSLGGYRDDFKIMEEYDLITRARKEAAFKIIPKDVLVSDRKYDNNSFLRVQIANATVFMMYRFGASQNAMCNTYKRLLNYR